MRNSIYSITLDEAIAAVGGRHAYQRRALAVSCLLSFAVGASVFSVQFLARQPRTSCEGSDCKDLSPCLTGNGQAEDDGRSTPGTEWNLICERSLLAPAAVWLYSLGAALGAVLLSCLERTLGRRKTMHWSAMLAIIAGAGICGSPHIYAMLGAICLKGLADIGCFLGIALSLVEMTDGGARGWFIALCSVCAFAGDMSAFTLSLLVPNWRVLASVAPAVCALYQLLLRHVQESPRFLAAIKGKYPAARSVLQHIATVNERGNFNDMLEGEKVIGYQETEKHLGLCESSSREISGKLVFVPITNGIVSVSQGDTKSARKYYHWHLLQLESVRVLMVVSVLAWTGLSVTLGGLRDVPGKDRPAVVLAMTAGDMLCIVATIAVASKMGRLSVSITYFAVCGLCCVLTLAFVSPNCHPEGLCRINAAMRGLMLHTARVFAQAELFLLFLYTLEVFPTVVRLPALSVCVFLFASSNCIWSIAVNLTEVQLIPVLLVGGVACLLISILACVLPDTTVDELLDYVAEEVEEMKKPAELSQVEIQPSTSSETSRGLQTKEPPFQVMSEEAPGSLNVP